jgi:hypothetical protein
MPSLTTAPTLDAASILAAWLAVAPVLKKQSAWLTLLRIAAAGPDGIMLAHLRQGTNFKDGRKTLINWSRAGLISLHYSGPQRGLNASNTCHIVITPRGLRFLRLRA